MKKMKRLLVAILSGLTAIACIAGVSACKNSADKDSSADKAPVESVVPDTNININLGGDPVVCVHDYSVVYQEVAATCDEEGYILKGCSKCGVELLVNTKKIPHDFAGATCADGNAECVACGEVKYESVDCTWVDATCTEDAYCSVCGAVDLGTAKGHDYVAATCTAAGYCSVCNEENAADPKHWWASAFGTLVEDGELASGFALAVEEGVYYVEDNCVDNTVGYEAFDFCLTCLNNYVTIEADKDLAFELIKNDKAKVMEYLFGSGKIATEGYAVIPVEHTMVDAFEVDKEGNVLGIAPTCETKGITANFQYCEVCSNMENVAKTFAAYDAFVNETVKVNNVDVLKYVVEGYEAVDALGHSHTKEVDGEIVDVFVEGKAATCTADSTPWKYNCTVCNKEVKGAVVAKYNHKVDGEYAIGVAATCTENAKCALCEAEIPGTDAKIAKTGHNFGEKLTVQPTCTTPGFTNYAQCKTCGATEGTTTPAKGHNWSKNTTVVAANCAHAEAAVGSFEQCSTCRLYSVVQDTVRYEYVDLASIVGAGSGDHKTPNYKPATCTSAALNLNCTVCETQVYDEQEALGHNYYTGEGVAPTCTENGKCGVCNVTVANSKLGHTWTNYDAVTAYCGVSGNKAYAYCGVCNIYALVNGTAYTTTTTRNGKAVAIDFDLDIYIPAIEHVMVEYAEVLSTCTVAGHSAYTACKYCAYTEGYAEYSKVSCASNTASCYATVACNCSYLEVTINTVKYVVAAEGSYKLVDGVVTLVEEGTQGAVKAVWKGCGEATPTTNVVPHNYAEDGFCTVCGAACAHNFVENECTICGKEELERQ